MSGELQICQQRETLAEFRHCGLPPFARKSWLYLNKSRRTTFSKETDFVTRTSSKRCSCSGVQDTVREQQLEFHPKVGSCPIDVPTSKLPMKPARYPSRRASNSQNEPGSPASDKPELSEFPLKLGLSLQQLSFAFFDTFEVAVRRHQFAFKLRDFLCNIAELFFTLLNFRLVGFHGL